jgi:hypothetical protein
VVYHTDPGTVAQWAPERMALGIACLELRASERRDEVKNATQASVIVADW